MIKKSLFCFLFITSFFLLCCKSQNEEMNKWIKKVEQGKVVEAVNLAQKFIKNKELPLPEEDNFRHFAQNGLSEKFLLIKNFNGYDFDLWESALFFHKKAEEIQDKGDPKFLVEFVKENVKHKKIQAENFFGLKLF